MMWNYGFGPGMGWFGWGSIGMGIIFIVLIFAVLFFVIRAARGGNFIGSANHEPPVDILKKRYAKGEITKDDFERMKKDLLG